MQRTIQLQEPQMGCEKDFVDYKVNTRISLTFNEIMDLMKITFDAII